MPASAAGHRWSTAFAIGAWLAAVAQPPAAEPLSPAEFVRGLNLNGPAVEIDGHSWEGRDSASYATRDNAFENQQVPLTPATDPQRALMIRSSRWGSNVNVRLTDLPPGDYQVGIYVWEDNDSETFTLALQDADVARDFRSGAAGAWQRLGPYSVAVGADGTITLTSRGGAANISGIEVWRGLGPMPGARQRDVVGPPPVTPEQAERFRTGIAPLLAKHCLECHNSSEPRGGLDLSDWQASRRGGESGEAIIPGKPEASLVWEYVASNEMPQKRPPLPDEEKQQLQQWIADGAPWADRTINHLAYTTDRRAGYDWWSLQPVQQHAVPPIAEHRGETALQPPDGWPGNEIDHFILAKLAERNLTPAEEADRRTLIRRVTFDVIGLPPSPDDVAAFVADDDPTAYGRLVDKLLDSPHYGERWARHWLDVIRFGESQGFERNHIRENAWRYRDWVIDAINRNLPYDEFVRQQLAGDVFHPDDLSALIATGYHVCGTWDMVGFLEGTQEMRKANRQDHLEDLVGAYGQAFLGLTLNCARCHDHKFDPIPQRDYYHIAAVFDSVQQHEQERGEIALKPHPDRLAERDFAGVAHVPDFQQPATTFVLARGNYRDPRDPVSPAGVSACEPAGLSADWSLSLEAPQAERRRRLAEWTTDPRHPLTARVFVNRLWYHHFGQGLVETPSDFGYSGGRPTHLELLDWLAATFIESGWDIRALHRRMLLSATYRQRSRVTNPHAEAIDADNRLCWRANRRRLEGEAVRDAVLFVSGALNPQLGGPSFRDIETHRNTKSKNDEFTVPTGEFTPQTCRRSIYRLWARSGNHPLLESLDCPDPTVAAPRRSQTITPLQALSLLNNGFMEQCAQRYAARIRADVGDVADVAAQTTLAFRLAFNRDPSAAERAHVEPFLQQHGLNQLCLTLLNSNEFMHVD